MPSTATSVIDGLSTSVAVKAPVKAVSSANLTLSGEQTVGGIACVTGNRVLVKNQTDASENGIYVVSTGSWTRAKDFDGNRDVVQGTLVVFVNAVGRAVYYQVTTANPVVIGTSSIAFALRDDPNVSYDLTTEEEGAGLTDEDIVGAYPVLNVLRYGADRAGLTSSTTAFRNAILVADEYADDGVNGNAIIDVPEGEYLISDELVFPTNWGGMTGAGRDNTVLNLSGAIIGLQAKGNSVFRGFTVRGSGIGDLQTGIRMSGSQTAFHDVHVRDCDQGIRYCDAFIINHYNVLIDRCENATVFCSSTTGSGFETSTNPQCQNINFFGGSIPNNTYAIRQLAGRNINFFGTDIEHNEYGVAWTHASVSGCNWDKCWFENNFFNLYIDKGSSAGGLSVNNTFSKCIHSIANSAEVIPDGFTDISEARFIFVADSTGGIDHLTYELCHFLTSTGSTATVGVETDGTLLRAQFIRNFWSSTFTYQQDGGGDTPIGIEDDLFGDNTINVGVIATDGDTSPTIRGARLLRFANASATTVTNLDDGDTNQEVDVLFDGNTTLSGANFSLTGSTLKGLAGDRISLRNISGVWTEQFRTSRPAKKDFNTQTGAYTLVLSDAGKVIHRSSGEAATWTIPANSSVAFEIGTEIEFINGDDSSITIAITTDTLTLSGTTTTGSRTLAQNGRAIARKVGSASWIISNLGGLT